LSNKAYWYEVQCWSEASNEASGEAEASWQTIDKYTTFFGAFLNMPLKGRIVKITEQVFHER